LFRQIIRYPDFTQTVSDIPVAVAALGQDLGPAQAVTRIVEVPEFPDPLDGGLDDLFRRAL